MDNIDSSSSVWLTGFWGFQPEEEGILGYTIERDRDRFFEQISHQQLVCIYGSASPETNNKDVHQLLGIIEVERTPIDSWEKMSDKSRRRNVELGRQDKWRFAMPVKRVWRTKHTLDIGQVFPQSYDPNNGRNIARFGTWLTAKESQWLLEDVPFTQVNVFGEPPITDANHPAQSMEKLLTPATGIFGKFGKREFEIHDKKHHLYLAQFQKSPDLLVGKNLEREQILVKIGISGNLKNRIKALNMSFPETTEIKWEIIRTAEFPNRAFAAENETRFKKLAVERYGGKSLGREYFVINEDKVEQLFIKLSPVPGLKLTI